MKHRVSNEEEPAKLPIPHLRALKAGERVHIPEIGLPNATLGGRGVQVAVWPDGRTTAVLPSPHTLEMIRVFIFCELILLAGRPFTEAELRFVRRIMNLTQDALALRLGVSRVTVSRYETGEEPIPAITTMAVQRIAVPQMLSKLNDLPDDVRALNRKKLETLQRLLTTAGDTRLRVKSNVSVDLEPLQPLTA